MLVRDLHHVSINVTDMDAALHFYVDVLGLEVLPRPELGIGGAWLAVGDGRQVHLIQVPVPPDMGQHFAFLVDDIDTTVATLTDAGVDVRGPIGVGDTGARQAFFADPDGNRLELNEPA